MKSETTKRERVLQVGKFYCPYVGGVERVIQDIAEGLKEKVDMEVLVCQPKGRGSTEVINGVKVSRTSSLGIFWSMPVSFTFPLLLAWKSRKADIIHFHLPFPLADLSYLLIGAKHKRLVVTYHSDVVRQKKVMWLYRPFLSRFLRAVDKILVTSPHLLDSSPYLAPYREKCMVVPLSIDLNEFVVSPKEDFDFGTPSDEKIVLFVGRLVYYKGLEYLLNAMTKVEAKLFVVGDGKLRKELEKRAASLGVSHKVTFIGRVSDEDLKHYYQACHLFVLPSVEPSEAFGIVQLEAMAYGKPVINTNLPTGVPYVSKHGETGLTVPPRDHDALAEAINKILNDRGLAAKFSENAFRRVKEIFSQEKMLNSIYSVYETVAKKPI